jgi:hypothetical protein
MSRFRRFARGNVLGLVAIFLALGGVAWAATAPRNSVVSKSIKDGQVRSADLQTDSVDGSKIADDSVTGQDVSEASLAGEQLFNDDSISADDIANDAIGSGEIAAGAVGQSELNARPTFIEVGSPDIEAKTGCDLADISCWVNFDSGGSTVHNAAAYARDAFGFVHLRGIVLQFGDSTPTTIFTLPPGFRPEFRNAFQVLSSAAGDVRVNVDANGAVRVETLPGSGKWLSLDGLNFQCGPAGANGCP